jgi:hypothetical protein
MRVLKNSFMFQLVLGMSITMGIMAGGMLGAQQPAPPQNPPTLSTSDRIALMACQKRESDATAAFNAAHEDELTIVREWQTVHAGWHLHFNPMNPGDPDNFKVEKDADRPAAKAPEKKAEPAKVPEKPADPAKK